MKDRNNANGRFIQVSQLPQIDSHLTAKLNIDDALDEASLVRKDENIDFNNNMLTNINSFTSNTQAVKDNQVFTKTYVDQFSNDNERNRKN